jgi:hypothetical protein
VLLDHKVFQELRPLRALLVLLELQDNPDLQEALVLREQLANKD